MECEHIMLTQFGLRFFGESAEDYLEEAVSLIPILVADREK